MEKYPFKPFEPVLVRDSKGGLWRANFYSHRDDTGNHVCISGVWNYCIPYNEETAHLLGTNKECGKTKKWHVSSHFGNFEEEFDDEELENFIKTAVMNNKDITNFHVRYIDK